MDVQTIDPASQNIVVSAYLPDARPGDTVKVHMGALPTKTYPEEGNSLLPQKYVHDVAFFSLSDIDAPGVYDVYYNVYRTGQDELSSPVLKLSVIDSGLASWRPHQCCCYGLYAPGLVDAWVVSISRRMPQADALIRLIDYGNPPTANVTLRITVQSVRGEPFRTIGTVTRVDGQWQVNFTNGRANFTRGDLVALQLDSAAFLNFAAAF
ncbi:hypothetical protein [Trinickia sp. EG282A]|uniref:hypothetical protein n=1 Tax=Trinickia sp. EG282A TaxID=3237013 RepID=UPI0034D2478A